MSGGGLWIDIEICHVSNYLFDLYLLLFAASVETAISGLIDSHKCQLYKFSFCVEKVLLFCLL